MVYLDYAASTPVDIDVLNDFYDVTKKYYANPNAQHNLGIDANHLIDKKSTEIARLLGCKKEELIYTSGATEANNMAIKGVAEQYKSKGKHIIISSLEHSSIVAPCNFLQEQGYDIDIVNVSKDGIIDLKQLEALIREDTILVSIISVDGEVGLIEPIEKIAKMLKKYPNVIFHTDASQAIGKVKIDFSNVDLVTIAPHKFYGLNGIGVLIKKENIMLTPIIHGGHATTIYRSGTPVVAFISSLALALKKVYDNFDENNIYVKSLREYFVNKLNNYSKVVLNSNDNSISSTINFSVKGMDSNQFLKQLSLNEVYVSTKASCHKDSKVSLIVYALTNDINLATSTLRISISHLTTIEEIDLFFTIFDKCYRKMVNNGEV